MVRARLGRGLPRALVLVLAISLLAAGAQALMVPEDPSSLAGGADGIVLGTVTAVESRWTADRTIETTALIALDATVRGTFPGRALTVTVQGGTVDGVTQVVEDEPVLARGNRGFYLLDRKGPARFGIHGARQGVIPVVDDTVWVTGGAHAPRAVPATDYGARLAALAEGQDVPPLEDAAAATASGPSIASVSPSSASAGTGTTITITGSGFGAKASRESGADVGFVYRSTSSSTFVPIFASGRPFFNDNVNDIVSWTDTRIVVRVPTGTTSDGYSGSASSGKVWVVTDAGVSSAASPFGVTFGYGKAQWASAPTFVVNGNCPGVTNAAAAVADAAGSWSAAVPSSAFRFVNGGTTTSTAYGRDGQNLICWRPASDFSSASTLAVTTWWYSGSTLLECDVRLNTGFSWTTGTASESAHSVEAIMLHEFGHWLNLRDLYGYQSGMPTDYDRVMFGYSGAGFGNLNLRTLSEGDLLGIRYIYGGGTAAWPDLVARTFVPPGGPVARTFTILNSVKNDGTRAAGPFTVSFCISPDPSFTTADTVIGTRSFTGLGAGVAAPELPTSVTIPSTVPAGTYYLGMIIDPADVVAESDEGNNVHLRPRPGRRSPAWWPSRAAWACPATSTWTGSTGTSTATGERTLRTWSSTAIRWTGSPRTSP